MSLDYQMLEDEGEWQIWTPDQSGGVLGSGASKAQALRDAISNCQALIAELKGELDELQPPDPTYPTYPTNPTERISAQAAKLGGLCLDAIRLNDQVLYSLIVEEELPRFLKNLAESRLSAPTWPTPAQLFDAMKAKLVDEIQIFHNLNGEGFFWLYRGGECRLSTPLWTDILKALDLYKAAPETRPPEPAIPNAS
jgi:hypothetical protein